MRKYLIFFFILFVQTAQAQESLPSDSLSGFVVYHQQVSVRMNVIKLDTLKFNRTKSIFHWNLYNPYNEKKMGRKYPNAKHSNKKAEVITGQTNFLDTEKDSLFSRKSMRMINTVLYLKEKKPQFNWHISDSTKKIGGYKVKKATTRFRGRNYTAWFTPKIPLPYGPWKLNGLPGLILQVYDQNRNFNFSATKVNLLSIEKIGPIKFNGKENPITIAQYKHLMNHFEEIERRITTKRLRKHLTKKQLANMSAIQYPNIELIETFTDSTGQ